MPFRATADGSINHQPDCFKGLANCNHLLGREARYLKVNLAQFAAMTETDSCELVELVLGTAGAGTGGDAQRTADRRGPRGADSPQAVGA